MNLPLLILFLSCCTKITFLTYFQNISKFLKFISLYYLMVNFTEINGVSGGILKHIYQIIP